MSSELERLQHLSLVSKVCQELDDHIGLSDATLAEFIIHLAKEHSTPESFANAVRENGADFGDSFAASLLETIHSMLPSKQGSAPTKTSNKPVIDPNDPKANLVAAFPGLAAPNKAQQFDDLDFKEIDYQEMKKYKEEKKSQQPRREDRDAADGRRGRGHRERSSRRDRGDSEEKDDRRSRRSHRRSRHSRSRSRSPSRRSRSRDRKSRHRSRSPRRSSRRSEASTEPELYHIYDGKVSKIMDFGCFVEVLPFKREGLVHIGQIQSGRLMHPRDAVGRGDIVKVKVISIAGSKISLSMKEVDQRTGEDLLPERGDMAAGRAFLASNPVKEIHHEPLRHQDEEAELEASRRPLRRLSSPERWEATQLRKTGALPLEEDPEFDEDHGLMANTETEEVFDVEMQEEEPPFLRGQVCRASLCVWPMTCALTLCLSLHRPRSLGSCRR